MCHGKLESGYKLKDFSAVLTRVIVTKAGLHKCDSFVEH